VTDKKVRIDDIDQDLSAEEAAGVQGGTSINRTPQNKPDGVIAVSHSVTHDTPSSTAETTHLFDRPTPRESAGPGAGPQ